VPSGSVEAEVNATDRSVATEVKSAVGGSFGVGGAVTVTCLVVVSVALSLSVTVSVTV
jgi:hypothetical protein